MTDLGLIPDEIIDEIRDRIDIVALIEEHVRLKKAGASHKGLCPFHGEKTPSFHVNGPRRSFYCFGCQKKGDAFTFLREMKGLSFVEAAQELARRAGVTIPERPQTPEERARSGERSRLLDVTAAAASYFRETLLGPRGAPGRQYLDSRGIGPEISEVFQLGYATEDWDGLANRIQQRRLPADAAQAVGLIGQRRSGQGFYDLFRQRVICPVIVREGEPVGFSGRTLSADDPRKYYNSPESLIYKKSNLLFGLHAARAAFARKSRAILVEGNFDVIALHQAGFAETVAPLGTALTEQQVDVLRRLAPVVILCLDGDKAGRAATMRAIPLFVAAAIETRVVSLPDGEDPDSFIRKQGAKAFEELLDKARPAFDHYFNDAWTRAGSSPDRQAAMLRELGPLLASINDDRREIVIGQYAKAMSIDPRILRNAIARGTPEQQNVQKPHVRVAPPPPQELKVFALLADHPELLPEAEKLGVGSLLTDVRLRDMYSGAQAGRSILDCTPPELSNIVAEHVLAGSFKTLEDPRRTLLNTANTLRQTRREAELRDIDRQIDDAKRRGDEASLRELFQRKVRTLQEAKRPEADPR